MNASGIGGGTHYHAYLDRGYLISVQIFMKTSMLQALIRL